MGLTLKVMLNILVTFQIGDDLITVAMAENKGLRPVYDRMMTYRIEI